MTVLCCILSKLITGSVKTVSIHILMLENLILLCKLFLLKARILFFCKMIIVHIGKIPKLQLFGNSCWHWIFLSFRLRAGLERVRVYKICICKLCFVKETYFPQDC